MSSSRRLPMALAIAVLTAGPATFAAANAQPAPAGDAANGSAAAHGQMTPQEAIAAAEQSAGGRATRIDVKHKKGADLYRVRVLANGAAEIVKIDAASGKILSTEKPGPVERLLEREGKNEAAKLQSAKTTLAAAIDTAEKQTGGKAHEARVEDEDGRLVYEVEMRKDHEKQRVRIDIDTGQVVVAKDED
jgi:uncharacterized membrane protein YkoI